MDSVKEMSLDEIIRKRALAEGMPLLTMRKKRLDVDKDDLDQDLDQIVRDMKERTVLDSSDNFKDDPEDYFEGNDDGFVDQYVQDAASRSNSNQNIQGSTCGRFNRRSMKDDDDESDEDKLNLDDIEMKSESGVEPRKFITIETKAGIRVPSQQWRLDDKNVLSKRPEGMKRLEFVPYQHNRFNGRNGNRPLNGRIGNRYQRNDDKIGKMSLQSIIKGSECHGKFVEKEGFTYKFDEKDEELISVERQNRFGRPRHSSYPTHSPQPINVININMKSNDDFVEQDNVVKDSTYNDKLEESALRLLRMIERKYGLRSNTKC